MNIMFSVSLTPNNVFGKIFNGFHINIMETLFLLCLITCEIFDAPNNNDNGDHNQGPVLSPIFFTLFMDELTRHRQ